MTHNILMCNKKGCTINNFPFKIVCTNLAINKVDFDADLVKRFLKKTDLPALTSACKDVYILYNTR